MAPLPHDLYRRLAAAKMFIDENYRYPINLERISGQAFLSRFHFHRLFTQTYRKTPHQYLSRLRLEAAKTLLEKEGISVGEVCDRVGFESPGSFSSLFRKRVGHSPQQYRQMARLRQQRQKEEPKRFVPHCFTEQFGVGR